jgi:radical SAM superfamily enzyme YgiQ (UPF0313 family)
MRIVLFDLQGLNANGLRSLSTKLKENSHSVKLIFERGNTYRMIWNNNYIYQYKQSVLNEIVDFCADADLVGFSVMTNFYDRARQLTVAIKNRLSIPVIWGGIHPTICYEECLECADIVCVGEAENTLIELVNKMQRGDDYFDTKGFVFKKNGKLINNALNLELVKEDEIPQQDYGPDNHYIIYDGRLVKLTRENFTGYARYQLEYETSRGCPYKCSYCCNDVFHKLYSNSKLLRKKKIIDIINDVERIINIYPDFKEIFFTDDDFMARSIDEFKEFASEYKKRIKIPFSCFATPVSYSEDKMDILFTAGLEYVNFGLQTVNENVQRQYNRLMKSERIRQIALKFNKYYGSKRMKSVRFDIMLESPFETDLERLNTIKFLLSLPIEFTLSYFSFTFYPGTSITDRAIKKGIIKGDKESIYRKTVKGPKLSLINLLFVLTKMAAQKKFPRWGVRLLSSKFIFSVLNRKIFNAILYHIGQYRYKRKYYKLEPGNYIE